MDRELWKWLPFALLTWFWWGVFGFLAKIGSEQASAADMQILFTAGNLPLVAFLLLRRKGLRANALGRVAGVAIGAVAGLGGVAYFVAMAHGQASLVGPVTSLFPLVTVVLAALVLRERLNRVQMAGIALALASAALLAS